MAGRKRSGKSDSPTTGDDNVGIFWMACDKCGGWEIVENTGIKGPYDEKAAKKATFTCKHCQLLTKFDASLQEIYRLNEKVKNLERDLGINQKSFAEAVKNMPEEIKSAKEKIVAVCNSNQIFKDEIAQSLQEVKTGILNAEPSTVLTALQLKQAADEVEEIAKRKTSLIISGLPEGSTDAQDLINFVQLYHKDVSVPSLDDFVDVSRVGKPLSDHRPRLLRVKLQTGVVRSRLLNLYTKRDQSLQTPKIFIRPDLTKAQAANDKKLREEWTNAGKDKFKISKGKIVPRSAVQPELSTRAIGPQSCKSLFLNQISGGDENNQFSLTPQQFHHSQDRESPSKNSAKGPPMTSNNRLTHSPQRSLQSQDETPSATLAKQPSSSSTSASATLSPNPTQQSISSTKVEAPLSDSTDIRTKDSVKYGPLVTSQAEAAKNSQSVKDQPNLTNNNQERI